MINEKSVTKITLEYDDDSQREISKGFIAGVTYNELENTSKTTFNLVRITTADLITILYSVIEFAREIGVMDEDQEDAEDEQS